MDRKALVIGAGASGLRAALDIAHAGIEVHLVERDPSIGGSLRGHHITHPTGEDSYSLMNPTLLEASNHPNIHLHTLSEVTRVERDDAAFRVGLLTRPRYIDAERCTGCGQCVLACPVDVEEDGLHGRMKRKPVYVKDSMSVPLVYAIEKEDRAPCVQRCPVHLNINGYVRLIAAGKYREAYNLIRERLPLPAVCGRVCFHPCEDECNRADVDQPVAINLLKRFVAEYEENLEEPERFVTDGKRVAVVGSGPSGLTCAYELAKRGYRPTVFEALPVKGGMLRVGIPSYRLPRNILDREIDYIEKSGVEIKTGMSLGKDFTVDGLMEDEGFEAVYLALGGHKSRKLNVEGEDLEGVVSATDFLRRANMGEKVEVGRNVIVVGGGNVALDCARVVRRLGPETVTVVCLESREEMPAHEWEIEHAIDEGIDLRPSFGPKRILGDGTRVTGIETLDVKHVFDEMGRFNPAFHPDTEKEIHGDMVILAIGQFPDMSFLTGDEGLELTRRGTVAYDSESLETSKPGVFTGGEVATGPSMAIEAIAMGRNAAFSIDQYLRGEKPHGEGWKAGRDSRSEDGFSIPPGVEKAKRADPGTAPAKKRIKNFEDVEYGLTEEMALAESLRCLSCGVCCECMECVRACDVLKVIDHDQEKSELTLDDIGAIVLAVGASRVPIGNDSVRDLLGQKGAMTDEGLDLLMSQWGPTGGRLHMPGGKRRIGEIVYYFADVPAQPAGGNYDPGAVLSRVKKILAVSDRTSVRLVNPPDDVSALLDKDTDAKKRLETVEVKVGKVVKERTKFKVLAKNGREMTRGDILVMAGAFEPDASLERLAGILSLDLDEQGNVIGGESPLATNAEGVYLCGRAAGSRNTTEAICQGSSVASRVQEQLWNSRKKQGVSLVSPAIDESRSSTGRTAVFVCECGGSTSEYLDVHEVATRAADLEPVVHAEVVTYLCSHEGVDQAVKAIEREKIDRVVTASCSCCSLEQICANCSTQRIRQKERLYEASPIPRSLFEPINIREQCAWAHHDDPDLALAKATDLVGLAVMRAQALVPSLSARTELSEGVLVCGSSREALVCAESLKRKGFGVSLLPDGEGGGPDTGEAISRLRELGVPLFERGRVEEVRGHGSDILVRFSGNGNDRSQRFGAVVLSGDNGPGHLHPVTHPLDTAVKGIFRIPDKTTLHDSGDGELIGLALSSRVSAYLSDGQIRSIGYVPNYDPFWCRGCGNCEAICEFGAFELVNEGGFWRSKFKPELCAGCGTCVANCPTGALSAGHASTRSLNSMFSYLGSGANGDRKRIIVFACHWSNFAGVDFYNIGRFTIPPEVRVVRVTCAGRLEESMIIKAFSSGADGVVVMGCGEEICHYQFGNRKGVERMEKARKLLKLLGIEDHRFLVTNIPAWETGRFEETVSSFTDVLREGR